MKLTKKQIDKIRANTPQSIKGTQPPLLEDLGYFMPTGANWSYRAGWASVDGARVLVVTRFGEVI